MTVGDMTLVETLSFLALCAQFLVVWFAYQAIKRNEATAKKRAIVDLILKQRDDKRLSNIFKQLYKWRMEKESITEQCKDPHIHDDVIYALDTMEFIAVGIRLNAFDEAVYKELQCTKVIKTWDSVSGFVMELREKKNCRTLYQDLEQLANSWNAKPIQELKKEKYK